MDMENAFPCRRGRNRLTEIIKKATAALIIFAIFEMTVGTAYAAEIPSELVPMGSVVGINAYVNGVIVTGLGEITEENGEKAAPARDAGIKPGDIITKLGGKRVESIKELTDALNGSGEKELSVNVERTGKELQLMITPCKTGGERSIGVFVRDMLSGIGTVTFYDPESSVFGALGHSINDTDTGVPIPLQSGTVMPADVNGIVQGKPGSPGQLGGFFSYDEVIGNIDKNENEGIFGTASADFAERSETVPVGSEIKLGPATIISTLEDNTPHEYDIEIIRTYANASDGRSMMIKVTDEDLIGITGGIVQGMSGSPILQNGKLIGAVTHVLINDPTKGYGIKIEDMLEAAA